MEGWGCRDGVGKKEGSHLLSPGIVKSPYIKLKSSIYYLYLWRVNKLTHQTKTITGTLLELPLISLNFLLTRDCYLFFRP